MNITIINDLRGRYSAQQMIAAVYGLVLSAFIVVANKAGLRVDDYLGEWGAVWLPILVIGPSLVYGFFVIAPAMARDTDRLINREHRLSKRDVLDNAILTIMSSVGILGLMFRDVVSMTVWLPSFILAAVGYVIAWRSVAQRPVPHDHRQQDS